MKNKKKKKKKKKKKNKKTLILKCIVNLYILMTKLITDKN